MFQIFNKPTIFLLAILLGMSFQYGAVAGSVSTGKQSADLNHAINLSDTNLFSAIKNISIQERSGNDDSSHNDQSCSSGHCTLCALAISPDAVSSEKYTSISIIPLNTSGFVSHISFSLFRPPKM
ncbi:hypothetical protein [Sedimenticola selenatireducens]|uniref:hypothetical protein n=1 Tax=Sedimenticola selenatireducens TaxID=191960 RepID=UPI0012F74211|nr:hypothetical protein [Sedimenticola selenatireducens]